LNELFNLIRQRVCAILPAIKAISPTYRDFRPGDVRHSLADISKARNLLGYEPIYSVKDGLDQAAEWYVRQLR
jgi:UDP-N-acetylglucosamine 4-epimerase